MTIANSFPNSLQKYKFFCSSIAGNLSILFIFFLNTFFLEPCLVDPIFVTLLLLFSSHVLLLMTPWMAACQASLFFTISQSLHKLMSIESVMPSNQLILCRLLFLPPSVFSSIRGSSRHVAKVFELQLSISPSNEYSGFNSFRIYWFDLLFVKGTLKCLFQYHNSKALILWHSAYFMVQLSHLYPFLVAQKKSARNRGGLGSVPRSRRSQ